MSVHLTPESIAGIVMLDASDPERVAAEAHARECSTCRAALEDAERTLGALDALAPPPAPSAAALASARRAVLAELDREPARAPWAAVMVVPLVAIALFVTLALALPPVREIAWAVALGVIAIVAGRTALALARGTSRDAGFALALGLGASAVIAVTDAAGDGGAHGPRCAIVELAAALLPMGAVAVMAWRGRVRAGALAMATVATSGALAGQLALRATCPDRDLGHLLASHAGGVLAAALLGAALGRLPALRPAARAG